jgi:hypothetical protein
MHLANCLQYFTNFLFSELEVRSPLYVDLRKRWTCHPNLFSGILNGTCILPPPPMSVNDPNKIYNQRTGLLTIPCKWLQVLNNRQGMVSHVDPKFSIGAIEVRFSSEIGAYTAHPNFRRWEMLVALPCTRYSGEVL